MHYPAGQSVGYFNHMESVAERIERLLQQTVQALQG